MASSEIHLAVAKKYFEKNNINSIVFDYCDNSKLARHSAGSNIC